MRTLKHREDALLLDFHVVAAVSDTLQKALAGALAPDTAELHDLQGPISTTPARVTLFLFETLEDPSARNRPPRPELRRIPPPPTVVLHKPPMALELHYLLTPWGGDRLTEHSLLGHTLQFFYDHAILSGPALQGVLAGTDQALAITLVPLPLEETTRVWNAVHKPLKLSVTIRVRMVNLVSTESQSAPLVARRTIDHALPEALS